MRVLMPPAAAAALLIAAGLLSVPVANAQVQSPSPGLSDQSPDIPDQKLDAAAAALARVASLKQDYQQRIAAAAPSDKERIANEAINAMAKAVPIRASRWRNTTPFWRWRRTIPRFAKKFVSASLQPNSRSSSRCRWPASPCAPDIQGSDRSHGRSAMQIKKHDRSHMVELRDGSAWRIWPGYIPKTLQWLPTTEIDVADIEDEICSHALVDRSNGSRVRVIRASADWPAAAVRRSLRAG
jgi:hypothetical protein